MYSRKHVPAKSNKYLKFPVPKGMYLRAVEKVNKQTFRSKFMVITSHAKLSHFLYRVMRIYGTIFSSPEPSFITVPHCTGNSLDGVSCYHVVHGRRESVLYGVVEHGKTDCFLGSHQQVVTYRVRGGGEVEDWNSCSCRGCRVTTTRGQLQDSITRLQKLSE